MGSRRQFVGAAKAADRLLLAEDVGVDLEHRARVLAQPPGNLVDRYAGAEATAPALLDRELVCEEAEEAG